MPTDMLSDIISLQLGKKNKFYVILLLKSIMAQHAQIVERKGS